MANQMIDIFETLDEWHKPESNAVCDEPIEEDDDTNDPPKPDPNDSLEPIADR